MKYVITRHDALVEYLLEIGLIEQGNYELIVHATPEQIEGQHVIGVLPLHLAAYAASVTEVPLSIPAELRGQELSIDQVRRFAGEPATYIVIKKE